MLKSEHVQDLAKHLVGNWKKFESFVWWETPDDDDNWTIVYTSSRDSELLEQSNDYVITKALEPFTRGKDPDVRPESHSHWGVGSVNGFAIRVYAADGSITPAFATYADLALAMQEYPVLDEQDYSNREYAATPEFIDDELRGILGGPPPKGASNKVFSWLWDNEQDELENVDDRGGSPSTESITQAVEALNIRPKRRR